LYIRCLEYGGGCAFSRQAGGRIWSLIASEVGLGILQEVLTYNDRDDNDDDV
jgi:hypothetical protein